MHVQVNDQPASINTLARTGHCPALARGYLAHLLARRRPAEYRFVHIAEDAKGFLWFTIAHSGANRIDGSEFETFTTHDGFSGNRP